VRLPTGDPIADTVDSSAQVIVALGPTGLAAPDDAGAAGAGLDQPDAAAPPADATAPADVPPPE
jgi:hypothetical protein